MAKHKHPDITHAEIFSNTKLHQDKPEDTGIANATNIHNTQSWAAPDCRFFNIGYYDIGDWRGWLCDEAAVPEIANQLGKWEFDVTEFSKGA